MGTCVVGEVEEVEAALGEGGSKEGGMVCAANGTGLVGGEAMRAPSLLNDVAARWEDGMYVSSVEVKVAGGGCSSSRCGVYGAPMREPLRECAADELMGGSCNGAMRDDEEAERRLGGSGELTDFCRATPARTIGGDSIGTVARRALVIKNATLRTSHAHRWQRHEADKQRASDHAARERLVRDVKPGQADRRGNTEHWCTCSSKGCMRVPQMPYG